MRQVSQPDAGTMLCLVAWSRSGRIPWRQIVGCFELVWGHEMAFVVISRRMRRQRPQSQPGLPSPSVNLANHPAPWKLRSQSHDEVSFLYVIEKSMEVGEGSLYRKPMALWFSQNGTIISCPPLMRPYATI